MEAVTAFAKGYICTKIPLQLVKTKLNLTSTADAEDLVSACGYYFDQDAKRYKRIADAEEWREKFKKWR